MRLTEDQISHLLSKGYSYEDMAIYEQQKSDAAKQAGMAAAGAVPMAGNLAKVAGKALGNLGKGLKQEQGTGLSGAASTMAKAGKAIGKGIKPPPPKKGAVTGAIGFGGFKDLVSSKIKQLQGEGISRNRAIDMFEDFASRMFGGNFLTENNSKLSKIRFNESELRTINNEWYNYLAEQDARFRPQPPVDNTTVDPRKQAMIDAGMQGGGGPATPEQIAAIQAAVGGIGQAGVEGAGGMVPQTVVPPTQIDPQTQMPPEAIVPQTQVPTPPPAGPAGPAGKVTEQEKSNIASTMGKTVGKLPGLGAAGAAAGAAAKALSKNEEMTPEKNHTALRDWTAKMKESLMQEKDYDGDGKVETGSQEYLGSRDKAIKKAMSEKTVFYTDDEGRKRVFDDNQ